MKLKILSWNIWRDGNHQKIADYLNESGADIIGLQEVQNDDPKRDIISYLKSLGYESAFEPIEHGWGGNIYLDGPAIFSKYKIISSEVRILSETDHDSRRAAIKADIKIGDETLHFISTHLVHTHQQNSEIQNLQAKNLLKFLPGNRTILVGDFNATPDSEPITIIKNSLIDTDSDSLPTWSVHPDGCVQCNPQSVDTKLDYIFTSKYIKSSSFVVGKSDGSDHLPISVEIEI